MYTTLRHVSRGKAWIHRFLNSKLKTGEWSASMGKETLIATELEAVIVLGPGCSSPL